MTVTLWCARAHPTTWPALAVFAAVGCWLSGIDMRHHLLPRRIVYPTLVAVIALVTMHCLVQGKAPHLLTALIGAASTAGFFYVIAVSTGGLGLGDVRLGLLTGWMAGWVGLPAIVLALLLTTIIGAIGGLLHAARRGRARVPYGPAMVAGTLLTLWVWPPP